MIAKSVAVTVALVLGQPAQMAPTNIDQAIYVTCRQAHVMNPEARKVLAMGVPRQPGRGQGRCGRQRLRPVAGRQRRPA